VLAEIGSGPWRGRYQTDPQSAALQDTRRCPEPLDRTASAGGQSQGIQLTVIAPGAHGCPWPHCNG